MTKPEEMRMLNQFERGTVNQGNSTSRRITMVPSLRTDLVSSQGVNSRYGGVQHRT